MTGGSRHIFSPDRQIYSLVNWFHFVGRGTTIVAFTHFLGLGLLIPSSSYAQSPIFQSHDFATEIDAQINCIFQDPYGLMWIGTSKGLLKYNGIDYELIRTEDYDLSMNVTAISVTEEGLVIASNGRLFTISSIGELIAFKSEGYPTIEKITGIEVDTNGTIIVSTYGQGLFLHHGDEWSSLSKADGLLGDDIYAIEFDLQNNLWIATDNGVSVISSIGDRVTISQVTRADGLNDEIVYSLAPDSSGMWLGFHSKGFCHVSFGSVKEVKHASQNWKEGPVMSLVSDGNGNMLIATEREGIFRVRIDPNPKTLDNLEKLKEFVGANQMLLDRNSRLWVTLIAGGLFSADLRMERFSSEIGDIQSICESKDSTVYAGTENGLHVLREGRLITVNNFSENVLSIYEDFYGKLWIGTFGNGVFVWTPGTDKYIQISEVNGLRNGSVFSIDGDSSFIWLATLDGIVEFDQPRDYSSYKGMEFRQLITDHLGTASVFQKVFVGADGTTWFGTSGQGVLVRKGQQLSNIMDDSSQYLKTVYCFAEDSEGSIWMATDKFGLFLYRNNRVEEFFLNENLRSKSIVSLQAYDDKIFCIHDEGVDVFDLHTGALSYLGSRQKLGAFKPSLNAVSEGGSHSIWIGASDGIYRVPNLSKINFNQPRVLLDEIYAWDRRIDRDSTPKLTRNENYLSIKYTGLWYDNPKMLSFQYKLVGQDLHWISTSDRSLTYANLSAGSYELNVRPLIYGHVMSDHQIQFPFQIRKAFYLQSWFLLLGILGIIGIILKVLQYRQKLSEKKFKDERDRIELKYEILKAQINPHFLFNSFNTLASFVEEDPKLAVEYIEKLSDYYRTITQYRDHKLITVEKELEIVMDYIFLLKKRFGENLNCVVSVDDKNRRIPPMTLQLLVENAVKHNVVSALKPLTIHIEYDGGDYLIVRNALQLKRGSHTSTNFGLNNVMNRVQMASTKEVKVQRTESEFIVHIPLVKSRDQ